MSDHALFAALPPPAVWVVDDDASIRFVLEKALERAHLAVQCFDSPSRVLAALDAPALHGVPLALVCDIRMPDAAGLNGLDVLAQVRQRLPQLPVIIMTAYSDLDSAVAAFQGGAFEYLPKPFDVPRAVALIGRAAGNAAPAWSQDAASATTPHTAGNATPPLPCQARSASSTDSAMPTTPEMLGQAAAMQDVFRAIGRLSQSHATVLITGESGTGKELVAHALHRHSRRATAPFVAINTAAIPHDLLESELFGHERGAFTGAQTLRRGRFEQAEGGTLFLDEIGDMPLELQTRLLRVLSDGHFYRVGGHSPLQANVRIIAATHQNLEDHVRSGRFREDLYHRLNVIRLRLPPLRERQQDIPMLAQHFLLRSAQQLGVPAKQLTPEAMQRLVQYPFTGNVRQLENICHWLTVMAPAHTVHTTDLPPEVLAHAADTATPPAASSEPHTASAIASDWQTALAHTARTLLAQQAPDIWHTLVADCERTLLHTALAHSQQRRTDAAQRLGIGRNTITRKMHDLGLEP